MNQKTTGWLESTAAKIVVKLENSAPESGIVVVEQARKSAQMTYIEDDVLSMMFDDGSVLFIESKGEVVLAECISAPTILKVLTHYRPFSQIMKARPSGTKQ